MSNYQAKQPDENGHIHFHAQENHTWSVLYERQMEILPGRAHPAFMEGLSKLDLPCDRIPQCYEVSEQLRQHTGWAVQPVPVIIPLDEFFELLANRRFPAATFIRDWQDLDYIQEPDIFHEFFGHCPLITHPAYARFLQRYGEMSLKADKRTKSLLGRLFWFTIEFGLAKTQDGLRAYGGGILSSPEETVYCLESNTPDRLPFEPFTVLRTKYRYDVLQTRYYVLDNFEDLFELADKDLIAMAQEIEDVNQQSFHTC